MKDDGTTLWIFTNAGHVIQEWNLSSPFDLSTATLTGSDGVGFETNTRSFCWGNEGNYLYVAENDSGKEWIMQFSCSTPYSTSSKTFVGKVETFDGQLSGGIVVSADGTTIVASIYSSYDVANYAMSTPWDVTTITGATNKTALGFSGGRIALNTVGTQLMVCFQKLIVYDLSEAWNPATAVKQANESSAYAGYDNGMAVSPDGSKVYIGDWGTALIKELDTNRV
jgi:sugar lactone lactonase YvrE